MKLILVLGFTLGVSLAGFAQNAPATMVESAPQKVSVFKNGYSFVHGEVSGVDGPGAYELSSIPPATLGTFWLGWDEGTGVENVRMTYVDQRREVPAFHIPELLNANIGNSVDVYIKEEWKRVVIIDVPKNEPVILEEDSLPRPVPGNGVMVVMKHENDTVALPLTWIEAVRLPNGQGTLTMEKTQSVPALTFDVTEHASRNPLGMSYMAKGISWSPSYVVNIDDEDKAVITSKAILMNDLLPLDGVNVELIAGFPHFEHKGTLEFLEQGLNADFSQFSATILANDPAFAESAGRMMRRAGSAPTVQGEQTEDLFFFMLDGVSLKKGERGYFQLFSESVPYEHLFTWDIGNFVDDSQMYRDDLAMNTPPLWHTVKLTNETSVPWTAAPAMTEKEGRVLGQDTIRFTPPGADMPLKITQAVMVKGEQAEAEIDRQPNVRADRRNSYDLVTIQGELLITNFRDEAVPVEVSKVVSGEVVEEGLDAEVTKLPTGIRSMNPQSKLVWKLDVEPGTDNVTRLQYTYKALVRSF